MTIRELLVKIGFDFNSAQVAQIESKINGIKGASSAVTSSVAGMGSSIGSALSASHGHINSLKNSISSLKSNIVGMVGLAAGGFGLFTLADSAITAGDNVYRLSSKLRLNSADAAFLSRILNSANVDANSFATTITRLDRSLQTAGDKGNTMTKALAEFGVNLKGADGQLLPVNKQLEALANGFTRAEEAGKSDEFVTEILGPRGMELIPVLRDYREAAEAASKVKGVGLDPQKAHEASVSMRVLKMQISQLGLVMANAFLPVVSKVIPKLLSLFQQIGSFANRYKLLAQSIGFLAAAFIGLFTAIKGAMIIKSMFTIIKDGIIAAKTAMAVSAPELFLIVAVVTILALALEDIYTWIQGGDSLMGDWLGSWDEFKAKASTYTQPLIDGLNQIWQAIQMYVIPAIMQIWDVGVVCFNAILNVVILVAGFIIGQFMEITNNGQVLLSLLLAAWSGFVNALVLLLQFVYQVFTGQWGAAIDTVIQFFSNLLNTALSILSQIGSAIGQYVLSKLGTAGQMLAKMAGIDLSSVVSAQNVAGAGVNGGGTNNEINVNVTTPEGTTAAQAEYLQQSAEQSYGGVYDTLAYAGGD